EILAQEMPLAVLFEDDHLLALDKPPGVVVHPAPGHHEGTLINALLWRARGWEAGQRPGLVNRLDRDTSGVLLVAKRAAIHAALTRSLRSHHGEKDYLALIYGATPGHGRIELRILRDPHDPKRRTTSKAEGQESVTLYRRIGEGGGLTLLGCRLVTGRTHQIRVHLQAQGWPLVGDPLYGEPRWKGIADEGVAAACRGFGRQALHARRLSFLHPATGERITIVAPLPDDLLTLLAVVGISAPVE
ncbi:MAG TPA: RluA family pseudouridine synthase, partial [Thermoanaerobaculia bacterium]